MRDSLAALGVELTELKQWNCCGASFPLSDSLLDLAGPSRILVSARSEGEKRPISTKPDEFWLDRRVEFEYR